MTTTVIDWKDEYVRLSSWVDPAEMGAQYYQYTDARPAVMSSDLRESINKEWILAISFNLPIDVDVIIHMLARIDSLQKYIDSIVDQIEVFSGIYSGSWWAQYTWSYMCIASETYCETLTPPLKLISKYVDVDKFWTRFDKLTCGLVEADFPGTEDVVIAGGVVHKSLDASLCSYTTDVDIFVLDTPTRKTTVNNIINYINAKWPGKTYWVTNGTSVAPSAIFSVYIDDINRNYQFIVTDIYDWYGLLKTFDTNYCKVAVTWEAGRRVFRPILDGILAIQNRDSSLTWGTTTLKRKVKMIHTGYKPAPFVPHSKEVVDITTGILAKYYPRSETPRKVNVAILQTCEKNTVLSTSYTIMDSIKWNSTWSTDKYY